MSFLGGASGKESDCNAGDRGSVPELGRLPGEGNGYPLQYACLENFTDRGAWWTTEHGVIKSQTQLTLSLYNIHNTLYNSTCMSFTNKWANIRYTYPIV